MYVCTYVRMYVLIYLRLSTTLLTVCEYVYHEHIPHSDVFFSSVS